jgi:HD superfamily phosphohydrolase
VDASIEALSGTSRPRRASDGVDGGARDHAWRGSTGADHRQLRHELRRILGRDFASLLTEALRGNGIIGRLVSSPEIDLDNIDNVFRMAAALGVHNTWSRDTPLRLATAFPLAKIEVRSVAFESAVPDKSLTEDSIREWLATRKEVYRVLNLHPVNLAGLAMLRELFDEYALVRPLSRSLWWTTDDDALKNLALEHTESLARRIRVGDLYSTLVVLHIDTVDSQLQALEAIVGQLRMFSCALENIIDCRVRVHAILDNGTFERPISIAIFDESSTGSVGLRSRSIIISVHGKSSRHRPPAEVSVREKTIQLLAAWFKVSEQRLRGALAPSEGAAEEYLHEAIQIKMPFDQ